MRTTHLYGDSEALHRFVAPHSDQVHANHTFIWALADEFVHSGFLVFLRNHGEVKRSEG